MATRVGFDVEIRAGRARERPGDESLRVLVAGNFSGGEVRKPVRLDIDNFEHVMARMAARLELPVAGETVELQFSSLDDFHPDALYKRLPQLQKLRARIADSGSSDAETIARLLGGRAAPASAPQDFLQALMREAVAPHIVPAAPAHQALYAEAADAAVAEQMRSVLHHPRFQALEALWRGVHRLVSNLENDEVKLYLLDAPREDLPALLGDEPWSLIVGDYAFGPAEEDLELLGRLGALGAPFLADAKPDIAAAPGWTALRKSEAAPWIGLAAPRVLMRLPYGKSADPIESFGFEEGRTYLWGSAALACALLMARGELELDDLPAHVFDEDGEKRLQPCAEANLSDRAGQELLDAGLMPLLSSKNRNAVRLMRLQSIASPPQALRGPWA